MSDQQGGLSKLLQGEPLPLYPENVAKEHPWLFRWIQSLYDYLRRLLGRLTGTNIWNAITNEVTTTTIVQQLITQINTQLTKLIVKKTGGSTYTGITTVEFEQGTNTTLTLTNPTAGTAKVKIDATGGGSGGGVGDTLIGRLEKCYHYNSEDDYTGIVYPTTDNPEVEIDTTRDWRKYHWQGWCRANEALADLLIDPTTNGSVGWHVGGNNSAHADGSTDSSWQNDGLSLPGSCSIELSVRGSDGAMCMEILNGGAAVQELYIQIEIWYTAIQTSAGSYQDLL